MTLTLRTCVVLLAICISAVGVAHGQGLRADYDRAEGLRTKYFGLVDRIVDEPNFTSDSKTLIYRRTLKGGSYDFVSVDIATLARGPAFDQAALARSLATVAVRPYSGANLPFQRYTLSDDRLSMEFEAAGGKWRCALLDYACERLGDATPRRGDATDIRKPLGSGRPERDKDEPIKSPDGLQEAYIHEHNLFVRPAAGGAGRQLTFDGTEDNYYLVTAGSWSPDSKQLAVSHVKQGEERYIHYVDSAPDDRKEPVVTEMYYIKPGDRLSDRQPVLIDVATGKATIIDRKLFPNAYSQSEPVWWSDGRGFYVRYNQRGHQAYRVIEVNREGVPRAIIDEQSKTYIEYSSKTVFEAQDHGREIVWMSERDGWCHLYLYDGVKGTVKKQITKGSWAVRNVIHTDWDKRQMIFAANGKEQGEDPYFVHFYRINFDGTDLIRLTDGVGTHTLVFSPDWQTYVDIWSRIDMAPVAQLRRASDGNVLMELERSDMSALLAASWTAPEPFVAKGRDGVTDIHGVIIRPSNFDPAKKYPVIENIYAGPQGAFTPKSFAAYRPMQAQAELGFIVVQMDGMGASYRSKAFHDVSWKNLADAGFPDRILWHKAVAAKNPWYDITRVGAYGGSAGGQNAMGALLFHPEFYDAAVAFAGSHDNRMDKIWWNEQYMGWPVGPEYAAASNVDNAAKLQGKLMLVVGELDTNVDPSSTFQVVDALIKANKTFDFLYLPGAGHTEGGAYGERKRWDFFVKNLLGVDPVDRNAARSLPVPRNADPLAGVSSSPN
ncbi:MAG: DPP IV N-terminal domain-containing protein [Hyphomonadaceae bacterium]|nr:DPP IV N-terminal domain-containing protein [Hyphomonadaceae bacterium]